MTIILVSGAETPTSLPGNTTDSSGPTFQNHTDLGPSRRSRDVRRVLHVTEEGSVVAELSRIQLYGDVPLVYVPDELDPVFELLLSREPHPVGIIENLPREGKTGVNVIIIKEIVCFIIIVCISVKLSILTSSSLFLKTFQPLPVC